MNRRSARSVWLSAIVCALLALFLTAPAMAADEIGIFWDTSYLQAQLEVPPGDLPALRTGYLVLKDPSDPVGILGWECLVVAEGPVQFLGWQTEGEAINVQTPPEFQVGIGGDPLPTTPDGILLATFQIYVTEYLPATLSLKKAYRPSIPNQMAFIPASDPDALIPMGTVTGHTDVAWINGELPLAVITPTSLNFGIIPQGQSRQEDITITNGGGGILHVEASIPGDCPGFHLIDYAGPAYLTANQSITITVGFTPTAIGNYTCQLIPGPTFEEPFYLSGASRDPIPDWTINGTMNFNQVIIGADRTNNIAIANTGETHIPWEPVLPPGLPDFEITYVNPAFGNVIAPGEQGRVNVTFTPTTEATYDFPLDLGPVLPDIPVLAEGKEPVFDWVLSPSSLDFGDVQPGASHFKQFSVTNTGQLNIPMVISLADTTLGFSIPNTPPTYNLLPGRSGTFTVWFASPIPGSFATELLLGDILPSVPLQANVPISGPPCLVYPPVLDFETVIIGETHTLDVYVTNQQVAPLYLDPISLVGYLEVIGGPVTLQYGESMTYQVAFTPSSTGSIDELVDLGDGTCELLQVVATVEEPTCYVNAGPLDFGIVAVEVAHMRVLQLQNPYSVPLTIHPSTESSYFSVPPGPITIEPGQTGALLVTLVPPTEGLYEGTVDLGTPDCEPVVCLAEAQAGHCTVSETLLAFGDVPVGMVTNRTVHVINDGPTTINVHPTINSPHFWTSPGTRTLDPGHSTTLTVYFQPMALESFQVMLNLGADICQPVSLTGTGSAVIGTTDDRIGMYFDTNYSQFEYFTTAGSYEVIFAYLVLNRPSDTSGIIGWECQFSMEGAAVSLGWTLEGSNINVGDVSTGEFIVGIASPLPWSPQVLLGTHQILSFLDGSESAVLSLTPVASPSLEGAMAYLAADDSGRLIPMTTITGFPAMAVISSSIPTPVEMPAPAVTQTAGQVQLAWSLPQVPGDGCHVYRLDPDGREERLTSAPVAPEGKEFRFVDQPFGYTNGAVLTYSYAAVTEGIEGVRSPGTEVRLSGVPAAPTQLLANVPNPFNPSTEVHFQLEGTQRVHVSIYDVNGRLVRTLVDAVLPAGPHHRTWDGRDNGGRAMSSGAYYLRLVADGSVDHRKMMLLK